MPEPTPTGVPQAPSAKRPCCRGFSSWSKRDAVALWCVRPACDGRPWISKAPTTHTSSSLVRHYGELRRDLWALDVTSDFGVPTFAAISRRVDRAEEDIIYGFGTHLDPGVALARALTELNQSLEAVPTATGPESTRTTYRGACARRPCVWWRTARIADNSYLMPDPSARPRRVQDFGNLASDDLYEDALTCTGLAAAKKGIEILVLDQTRPDVGLPVVRVVAPGLRHSWARFGPGRLYDVPVRAAVACPDRSTNGS